MNNNNNNNENLFWNIFRNKYLNNLIFSNLYKSFKYEKYNYNQIISIEWMLKNSYIELLITKVKNNEYLTFGTNSKKIKELIYMKIQNDQEFYNCLFKNYSIYFEKELNSNGNGKKQLLETLIKFDCLSGLKELIFNYNLKIKEKHQLFAFENSSFSIAEFINEKYNFKISSNRYWNLLINPASSSIDNMDCKTINNKVLFLINNLNLKLPDSKNDIPKLNGYCINELLWTFTLTDLINTCITISYLRIPLKSFIKNIYKFNEKTIKFTYGSNYSNEMIDLLYSTTPSTSNILTIKEINELKISNNFTTQQLSSKLENLDFSSNQFIEKLFKMVLPFIGINFWFFQNFIFYNIRFSSNKLKAFSNSTTIEETILIFSFTLNREIKRNYLNSISNYLENIESSSTTTTNQDKNFNNYLKRNLIPSLFQLFLKQDDFEFIKFTTKKLLLLNSSSTQNHYSFSTILDNVSSLKVFQYLYIELKEVAYLDFVFLLKRNPKLLNYFKQLYPNDFKIKLYDQKDNLISFISSLLKNSKTTKTHDKIISLFLYENLSIFNNDEFLNQIIPIDKINLNSISFNEFYYFFQISKLKNQNTNIYNNIYSLDSNILKIEYSLNERLLLFYYYSNNLENLKLFDKEFFYNNSRLLFATIGKNGDIGSLSFILDLFKLSTSDDGDDGNNDNGGSNDSGYTLEFIKCLDVLYLYSSYFGQIQIFKFMKLNHPKIYNEQENFKTLTKHFEEGGFSNGNNKHFDIFKEILMFTGELFYGLLVF